MELIGPLIHQIAHLSEVIQLLEVRHEDRKHDLENHEEKSIKSVRKKKKLIKSVNISTLHEAEEDVRLRPEPPKKCSNEEE